MAESKSTCAHCSGEYQRQHSAQKYCGDKCRRDARRENGRVNQRNAFAKKAAARRCSSCGGSVPPGRSKFCGRGCHSAWARGPEQQPYRNGLVESACVSCGSSFVRRGPNHKACSPLCKRRINRAKRVSVVKHRLSGLVRSNVRRSLRAGVRGWKWEKLVGFTLEELKAHLEARFAPGMGWHNMGAWHIDHIRPIASFDFESVDDEAFRECWALSNLQPLWAVDNIRKGSTYGVPQETNESEGHRRQQAA